MALSIFKKDRYNAGDASFISDTKFYLVVAAVLFFGFAVNAVQVIVFGEAIALWVSSGANFIWFLIGYFVLAVAGIIINAVSRNPIVSFIGYCLVVLPVGSVLALVVPVYSIGAVRSAFLVTTLLTAIFMLVALVWPNVFMSIWKVVSICLFVALIWSVISMFTGGYLSAGGAYIWLDWLIVIVFCCYIGFDISLARSRPKTMDNAVDTACGLYLDLINLFIRLLAIFGRSRD